jgi:hypothetical protein
MADTLRELATLLTSEPLLAPHVRVPEGAETPLGSLAAAGPRAAADPDAYALIVEAVREGYLLHYEDPRLLAGLDPDLALLAGDHLYALGLDRLAGLADLGAVRELSDLISLAAQVHDGSRPADRAARELQALWLATATAVGAGSTAELEAAKEALRAGSPEAEAALRAAAESAAAASDIQHDLGLAAERIESAQYSPPELG